MRKFASSRILLLAVLLAASHVMFASHITTHLSLRISSCECCICQGQPVAGPLPGADLPPAVRQVRPSSLPIEITLVSEPASRNYQSRAPPAPV